MTKPFEFFTAGDFDKLRSTLAAHLSQVMPERNHREAILNLIHDVQTVAADRANQLLNERGVVVFGDDRSGVWTDKATVTDTKEALLLPPRRMRCLDGK